MCSSSVRFGVAVAFARAALSAFTKSASYGMSDLVQMDSGGYCYKPLRGSQTTTTCDNGNPWSATFSGVLRVHLQQPAGLSIAYYDKYLSLVGGAIWTLPSPLLDPVFVCFSGVGYDGTVETRCRFAHTNDDFADFRANGVFCAVGVVPSTVNDGCFDPPTNATLFPPSGMCTDDSSSDSSSMLDTASDAIQIITSVWPYFLSGLSLAGSLIICLWRDALKALCVRACRWLREMVNLSCQQLFNAAATRPTSALLSVIVPTPSAPNIPVPAPAVVAKPRATTGISSGHAVAGPSSRPMT